MTFALEDSIVDFYRTFEISIVDFGRIKNVRCVESFTSMLNQHHIKIPSSRFCFKFVLDLVERVFLVLF